MLNTFATLEHIMNKSSIEKFRRYVEQYKDVKPWMLFSDYCFDDKDKPNNVVSFVFYPCKYNPNEIEGRIQEIQPRDLKHTQNISQEFCEFISNGLFFSFNFILDKGCIFSDWNNICILEKFLENLKNEMKERNTEIYKKLNSLISKIRGRKNKSKTFSRVLIVTFLASYLRYLLLREHGDVQLYMWFSDIDAITQWEDKISTELYYVISKGLSISYLDKYQNIRLEEYYPQYNDDKVFFEQFNKIPDFICGAIADISFQIAIPCDENQEGIDAIGKCSTSGEKQYNVITNAIMHKENIVIIKCEKSGNAIIEYAFPPIQE